MSDTAERPMEIVVDVANDPGGAWLRALLDEDERFVTPPRTSCQDKPPCTGREVAP